MNRISMVNMGAHLFMRVVHLHQPCKWESHWSHGPGGPGGWG